MNAASNHGPLERPRLDGWLIGENVAARNITLSQSLQLGAWWIDIAYSAVTPCAVKDARPTEQIVGRPSEWTPQTCLERRPKPRLLYCGRAPKESVDIWPLAINIRDEIGGTPVY